MEHYKTVELGSFQSSSQPFIVVFAFPLEGPIVIKGMLKEVQDYIWNKLSTCHYKVTYWDQQRKMNEIWHINSPDWNILCNIEMGGKRRYVFTHQGEEMFVLRRIPKHFIEELRVNKPYDMTGD